MIDRSQDLRKPKNNVIDEQQTKTAYNPLKTNMNNASRSPSPHQADTEPDQDPEFETKDIDKMYHEHLRRKEQIRQNIERMTREK